MVYDLYYKKQSCAIYLMFLIRWFNAALSAVNFRFTLYEVTINFLTALVPPPNKYMTSLFWQHLLFITKYIDFALWSHECKKDTFRVQFEWYNEVKNRNVPEESIKVSLNHNRKDEKIHEYSWTHEKMVTFQINWNKTLHIIA